MSTTTAPAPAPSNGQQAIAAARRPSELVVFRDELTGRIDRFKPWLPEGITITKFIDTVMAAVASNPTLLNCERASLHLAAVKAARAGLLPDGKESCIVPRKGRAEFQAMVYGVRKRFLELGEIIVDAQVVHERDRFHFELGDEPFIHHSPADPRERGEDGKFLSRGDMCAAYAIFRKDGKVLHREVMYAAEIETIKKMVESQYKEGKASLMWSRFPGEAWRKSVVHRGSKSLPQCPELAELFDDGVDWTALDAERVDQGPKGNPLADPDIDLIADDTGQAAPETAVEVQAAPAAAETTRQPDAADQFAAELEDCTSQTAADAVKAKWREKINTQDMHDRASRAWSQKVRELAAWESEREAIDAMAGGHRAPVEMEHEHA
jgi:hypothetical protein